MVSLSTHLVQHSDERGTFVELLHNAGGQVSFSTSAPGVTRGNHVHQRKVEKFAVIAGQAVIRLRKLDSDEVIAFYVDGNEPEVIDIPTGFVHNITNTGTDTMYLIVWASEQFDSSDPDTKTERV